MRIFSGPVRRLPIFVLVLVSTLLTACETAPPPPPASAGTAVQIPMPAEVSDAPLVDSDGKRTSLGAWRGKVVVLTDFLTLCQEICPLTSVNFAAMAEATRAAGLSDSVQFVELTVDPERDTAERLAAYRSLVGSAPNWTLLTGAPDVVATVWAHFGVSYGEEPVGDDAGLDWWTGQRLGYDVGHTDALIFIDEQGEERFVVVGAPNTEGRTPPPALDELLNAEGQANLHKPDPSAWTVPQALGVLSWLLEKEIPAT